LGNTAEGINSPDGLTVFGFGRDENVYPLLIGNHKFEVGFFLKKLSKMMHIKNYRIIFNAR